MRHSPFRLAHAVLLLLWGSAFSDPPYLILKQSHHTALSKAPVYVEFYVGDNSSSAINATVSLLDTKRDTIITSKELPVNASRGLLEFECVYLMSAGLYRFQMNLETRNDSSVHILSGLLNITWPIFYMDLNRTSKDLQRSFQVGLFTNEQLCSGFSGHNVKVLLEVEHTRSFQGLEEPNTDHFMLYKTYKEIPLMTPQWVEFECASVQPEAYITVSLKPIDSEAIIAHIGPVDLVKTFKYKLLTVTEKKCDSSMIVNVIAPPCNYVEGKIIVYKEYPRSPGEEVTTLAEKALQRGDRNAQFNCSLFDIGKNKYCFELLVSSNSNPNYSFPRAKQCAEIRREIETWSLWQPWSSCSVTCGEGQRERHRTCLSSISVKPFCKGAAKEKSLCSLDDCLPVKPSSKSTTNNMDPKTSNTVTITGISLCLFIIFITVVITIWRKFGKSGKCSPSTRHSSAHSVNCWRSSDEENIYQVRESFSDGAEAPPDGMEDGVNIPLNYRQSINATEEAVTAEIDGAQANTQKIIPPIYSYRLAQQQLKEMKQKGLTQATKMYHVSQNPMVDTALDVSFAPSLAPDNSEEMTPNKFRIQSPFLESKHNNVRHVGERLYSNYPATPRFSPSQTFPKASHNKPADVKMKHDRGHQKNNFHRTSSFHETKQMKPYRERSLTSLSPRQTMVYNSRTRMWEYASADRPKQKLARITKSPEILIRGVSLPLEAAGHPSQIQHGRPEVTKPDLICSRNANARQTKTEHPEQSRVRKGPSPGEMSWKRGQNVSPSKDLSHRSSPQSPSHYRREKCQSFPWGPEFSFYDNSTFGLTEAEQEMLDLPGYFASNEEDETSTLSIERLVV